MEEIKFKDFSGTCSQTIEDWGNPCEFCVNFIFFGCEKENFDGNNED